MPFTLHRRDFRPKNEQNAPRYNAKHLNIITKRTLSLYNKNKAVANDYA